MLAIIRTIIPVNPIASPMAHSCQLIDTNHRYRWVIINFNWHRLSAVGCRLSAVGSRVSGVGVLGVDHDASLMNEVQAEPLINMQLTSITHAQPIMYNYSPYISDICTYTNICYGCINADAGTVLSKQSVRFSGI